MTNHIKIGNDPRFPEPKDGIKEIVDYKNGWTDALGSRSLVASYAIIGSAWAVFGEDGQLLDNKLAIGAVTIAILHIGASLFLIFLNVKLLSNRFWYAQNYSQLWEKEWSLSADSKSVWPFTKCIQKVGTVSQWINVGLPVIGGLLLIGAFWSS